jgi:hypothetical protein
MTQATSKSNTSRRAVLAAALAATPALAIPTQAIGSETDSELLELGQRLRAHIARAEAAMEKVAVLEAEIEERCPIPDREQVSRKDLEAAHARREQVGVEIGHYQAFNTWSEVRAAAEPILRAITQTRATSFAGLLVKAEAMVWEATSWTFNPDFPPEWKDDQILDLVATLFVVGQQPVPAFPPARRASRSSSAIFSPRRARPASRAAKMFVKGVELALHSCRRSSNRDGGKNDDGGMPE